MSLPTAFCLLLLLANGFSDGAQHGHHSTDSNDHFDFLIFTQHWPQTVCYLWQDKNQSNKCSLPSDNEWTIHGLWPTKNHTIGPAYCSHNLSFNVHALKSIESELRIKWIDIQNGTKPYAFWRYEWQKHGTCAVSIPELSTVEKYFGMGLALLDKYEMKEILAKVNILPANSYHVDDVLKGIKKVLGVNAQVQCARNSETGEHYLFEIRICFDKHLDLIDCDYAKGFPTNCPRNKTISYPSVVPKNYQVIQI